MKEETIVKTVFGIDVSKGKFDVCLMTLTISQSTKIKGTRAFENTARGISECLDWLAKKGALPLHVLMEATGSYYERLAYKLYQADYTLQNFVNNPPRRRDKPTVIGCV